MSSSSFPSAETPRKSSAIPPTAITAAPTRKAIITLVTLPESIIFPKNSGPVMPPAAVPTA
jgi:hypothetical protein